MAKATLLEAQLQTGHQEPPSLQRLGAMIGSAVAFRSGRGISSADVSGQSARLRSECAAYPTLGRTKLMKHRMAYGAQALWLRSLHSSPRAGKPSPWRRETGSSTFRTWRYA